MKRVALLLFISLLSCTAENPVEGVAEQQDASGGGDLTGEESDSGAVDHMFPEEMLSEIPLGPSPLSKAGTGVRAGDEPANAQ